MTDTNKPGITLDVLENDYNKDLIENGAWLHFTGNDGELKYLKIPDDKEESGFRRVPVRAKVRSILSEKYDEHMDKLMEGASNRARRLRGDQAKNKMLRDEMKKQEPKSFAALVVEMENVSTAQPGVIKIPQVDLMHFAIQPRNKDWVKQVLEFSGQNENYGGEESEAVKAGKDEPGAE